jgi:hypothetical protein
MLRPFVPLALLAACQTDPAPPPQQATSEQGARPGQPAPVIYSCFPRQDSWFRRTQRSDGAFADDDGEPRLRETCLAVLAELGDGSTMRAGPDRDVLRRAVGWLRERQQDDGSLDVTADDPIRQQALAAYTLVEAFGVSEYRGPMRRIAGRALDALLAQRNDDGGWPATAGAPSDPLASCWAALACDSARHFGFDVEAPSAIELLPWFGAHPATTAGERAALLLVRQRLGDDAEAELQKLALRLATEADPERPEAAFWTSFALFPFGGEAWQRWQRRLGETVVQTQDLAPDAADMWLPVPGFSSVETTALRTLTLEAYYRYSRLIR